MKSNFSTTLSRNNSLLLELLVGCLFLAGLYLISRSSYLLFHSLTEIFTIVIACGTFMLAWNGRLFLDNQYFLVIGIASLSIGSLDLMHTLTYQGMGVIPVASPNLATQFWVAGRYVQCLSFLAAPFFIKRKPNVGLLLLIYTLITLLLITLILVVRLFPVCYIPGVGLTPFKRISELVVIGIFLASILLVWKKRSDFEPYVFRLLVLSLVLNIGAEIFFSLYLNIYGSFNEIGHFFRFAAYFALYKGIVQTGFLKPYDLLFRNLRQHESELSNQTLELQKQNEDLDAYAHSVAHDLKNPLYGIISVTNALMLPEVIKQDRQKLINMIQETAFHMTGIIDNLLLFAEVRKCEAPFERLEMEKIVQQAILRLATLVEEKDAKFIFPNEWPEAMGYAQWVEEVWVNYLSNALKYGGKNPCIQLGAGQQADGQVRFWVKDQGRGLSAEERASLFVPYDRLEQVGSSGYGLGLSIVRRIIEKLGGQVGVESQLGNGSTFYFSLKGCS